ncbi:MAG TPA: trypsin-like peptidase domain-containing protein [Candidatus Acidoferrales bacterium]|nr:trypsin-like peptidase domain-containing protein [Candidatus Acidoferrales bacterium]
MNFPSRALPVCVCLVVFLLLPPAGAADTLKITSNPSGATVEVDGVAIGTTPCTVKYPGGYFHGTKTIYGNLLQHPLRARISMEGFVTKEVVLTDGPMERVNTNGRVHQQYYLLKADHFDFELVKVDESLTGILETRAKGPRRVLSVEEIARRAGPAVVLLRGVQKRGTGFLITDTGVIATNAHVVRDETKLVAVSSAGADLPAKIVYLDADMDFALVKVEGAGMPHLTLADTGRLAPGQNVVAIGNPGAGMANSVSKGIVSAVGPKPELGVGTWIQTDAAVNPGNSGGPLLNSAGEVIGINTARAVGTPADPGVSGIGFALSSGDMLRVLRRFYPGAGAQKLSADAPEEEEGTGSVKISSDPDAAEIYVDGKFVGTTPSMLHLAAGPHDIEVKAPGRRTWRRTLEVLKDNEASLKATLDPEN